MAAASSASSASALGLGKGNTGSAALLGRRQGNGALPRALWADLRRGGGVRNASSFSTIGSSDDAATDATTASASSAATAAATDACYRGLNS